MKPPLIKRALSFKIEFFTISISNVVKNVQVEKKLLNFTFCKNIIAVDWAVNITLESNKHSSGVFTEKLCFLAT
jgi:hypothetical protein